MNNVNDVLNILIIDDEEGMCMGASRALSSTQVFIDDLNIIVGFSSRAVHSYSEYKTEIVNHKYDLILLDYKLPDGSGLDILQELNEQSKETLVIMMTAYATFETAVQATKLGAYDFLAKPFTPEELRNSVRKAATRFVLAKRAKSFEEEKRKIRFEFISVLSHELKSPINAIDGYLKLLHEGSITPDSENYQMAIERSLLRLEGMRKLIFDLLDMTRIESGQKTRKIEPINLIAIINLLIEQNTYEAKLNGITLNLVSPNELSMDGDQSELEIILNNLINNAIKYNKPSGTVDITVIDKQNQVEIQVKDSGIGLSRDEQDKLFNDFVRIKNPETIHIQGSGLGLSTIKKITALYEGSINVTSQKGIGSTFQVTLKKYLNDTICPKIVT